MSPSEVEALLVDLESDRVERTVSTDKTDKFGEAICAFANDLPNHRQPGYLIVGADDRGRVVGIEITDRLLQALAGIRSDGNLLPPPAMTVEKLDLLGGSVAVVSVQPSTDTPVRYKGRVWVRVGPRRGWANGQEEILLSEKRAAHLARTWDARPCLEAALEDLALDLFTSTYRRAAVAPEVVAENDRPLEQQLSSLRFWDARARQPTNAGVLLFGQDPLYFFPGAYVQYVRYGGENQAAEVLRDRRLTGDFLTVLRGLEELALDLAGARPVALEGFRERTIYDYPPRALRELFVNAVVHRNYESSTAPTRIDHFEDRLEIFNPGGLHPALPLEQFPVGNPYRNPILAEAARVLGYANRFNRGIALVEEQLSVNDSPKAEFQLAYPSSFMVVVRKHP